MPGVFPSRRLGDHMCVDGGVREVVPVRAAVEELGCNNVIVIRCSAPVPVLPTNPRRGLAEVIARSLLEVTFDEVAESDIYPYRGWGEGVTLRSVEPQINLHDPMVVEPGLIRIGIDYGWMRAGEVLNFAGTPQQVEEAAHLSKEITALRAMNWRHTHWCAGSDFLDPHRSFVDLLLQGINPPAGIWETTRTLPDPEVVAMVRTNCLKIRDHLARRAAIRAPTQPSGVTPALVPRLGEHQGAPTNGIAVGQVRLGTGVTGRGTPPRPGVRPGELGLWLRLGDSLSTPARSPASDIRRAGRQVGMVD